MKHAWLIPEIHAALIDVKIVKSMKFGAKDVNRLVVKQITGTKLKSAFRPQLYRQK